MEGSESASGAKTRQTWTFNRLLLALAFVDLLLAFVVLGGFSLSTFLFAGPFLIPAIVTTALIVWRPNPWFYLAAGIGISFLFIVFLPFIIAGLSNPASPYDFSGNTLGLVSVFWALPAGVIGFLRARKGQPMADMRSGWRTRQGICALAVAFIATGMIVSSTIAYGYATGASSGGGFDFAPSTTVSMTTVNFAFSPATLTIPLRTVAAIVVTNKDSTLHTFTYEVNGKTYSHDLLPGTTKFLVFFDAAGAIPFWCVPHRAMGMTGTITVS